MTAESYQQSIFVIYVRNHTIRRKSSRNIQMNYTERKNATNGIIFVKVNYF